MQYIPKIDCTRILFFLFRYLEYIMKVSQAVYREYLITLCILNEVLPADCDTEDDPVIWTIPQLETLLRICGVSFTRNNFFEDEF